MIDFHAHILPKIDDGSNSTEESLELLKMLASQNVDTVIATPHYSIRHQSDTEFLQNREESYNRLKLHISDDMPLIIKGAEVEYFSGISRSEFVRKMRVEKTRLLLIEMPFVKWQDRTVHDILQLCCTEDVTPVLAHIERYYRFTDFQTLHLLADSGVLFQTNCSALLERETRRKTDFLLRNGLIQFIGTDCHYLPGRFPDMDEFVAYVNKKLGRQFLAEFLKKQDLLFEANIL